MTTMQIRDVSLYVEVIGQGHPLLLMHGGPGLDYTTLLHFRPCADQFTLIFYDHRCHGRSTGAGLSSLTWDNLTADAEALRQALGFDRWAVLGHSFGGNVALEYALRYPQSLSHLILMDTGGDSWWSQHNAPELLAKRGYKPAAVDAARRFFNGQLAPDEFSRTFMKFGKAYFYRFSLFNVALELVFGPRLKMRPEAQVFGFSQLLPGWSVMDRLDEIRVPTLVLAGRHDFLFPPESQAILADRLPNAQLELVEFAGHNPHDERPAETLPIVRRFLAQ
jgi:pimeloyl-ACP methyl ester carboxylesterase